LKVSTQPFSEIPNPGVFLPVVRDPYRFNSFPRAFAVIEIPHLGSKQTGIRDFRKKG
jgi:hypothetical protein